MTQIWTRLHHLIELVGEDARVFADCPHYVIEDKLLDVMTRADLVASVQALLDAEICRLPYPEMLIEFGVIGSARRFVKLIENGTGFRAQVGTLYKDMATIAEKTHVLNVWKTGLAVTDGASGSDAEAIVTAGSIALLLLNTRGVQKELIAPDRINKSRQALKREPVPRHTVLRIGTVYDRDGFAAPSPEHHRKPMKVHLRAGHTRNQAYGENWSLRRPKYIPPALVNYQPGAVVPHAQKVVTL